jgi:YrbI family 3-deoxy-D-manno-octulosonate 8-phosphate phosphatase
MKIDYVFQGVSNKAEVLKNLCNEIGISLEETAYIGDDVNDLSAIKIAGFSVCPADAVDDVKECVDVVLHQNGGSGAMREWCEEVLQHIERV